MGNYPIKGGKINSYSSSSQRCKIYHFRTRVSAAGFRPGCAVSIPRSQRKIVASKILCGGGLPRCLCKNQFNQNSSAQCSMSSYSGWLVEEEGRKEINRRRERWPEDEGEQFQEIRNLTCGLFFVQLQWQHHWQGRKKLINSGVQFFRKQTKNFGKLNHYQLTRFF